MRNSIFDIEKRLNMTLEYKKIKIALFKMSTIGYMGNAMSLYSLLNKYVFPFWKYRDTFESIDEYLTYIGVNIHADTIKEDDFLLFMELLLNLWEEKGMVINHNRINIFDQISYNIIKHNIPIILEKMNYQINKIDDKLIIKKRDADTDSILDIVPKDISLELLKYNDIRNNNKESKKKILKNIDLYIEENSSIYKSFDSELYSSIGMIVNEMGVNHPIHKKYKSMSDDELCLWYDRCFKMMIHLIRFKDIKDIKKERKKLINAE